MIRSSIAKKAVVAITGAVLFAYVIVHMLGNLQIFLGRETINRYAEFLHSMPELLWTARLVLLASVGLHIYFTLKLARENRAARPQPYVMERTVRASRASRIMVLSGLLVLAFIVYHLLHFTVQVTNPDYQDLYELEGRPVILVRYQPDDEATASPEAENEADAATATAVERVPRDTLSREARQELRRDVYRMVIVGFRSLPIALTYIIAQVLLGFHLWHGASALFQTLGLTSPKHRPWMFLVGPVMATIIVIGNVSIPLAILLDYWTGAGFFKV